MMRTARARADKVAAAVAGLVGRWEEVLPLAKKMVVVDQ